MRFAVLVCLVLSLLAVPVSAQPSDGLNRADAPDWIDRADLPAIPEDLLDTAKDGVFTLLVDSQAAWRGETELTYFRLAQQVIDRAGLEAVATVSQNFDPTTTKITLVRMDLVRDGQVTPLRDAVEADIFRRETRLDAGIIDGTMTVHLQVPDLRVGDTVDYAFLTEREPRVPGAERDVHVGLEYSSPVALARHVAYWPADWPFHVGPLPEDRIEHSEQRLDEIVRHEWRSVAHRPWRYETMTPVEAMPYADLQYGAAEDWSTISAALTPYYEADYPLTADWDARIAAIMAEENKPAGRAMAALRLVQDNIRYVGVEIGPGGIFARKPATVIEQGFGDCKDKALLLNVLLARMGIEAYVALTDLDEGFALSNALPRLTAFDHMITMIRIGGQTYWMDPTGSHEGGDLFHASAPDYGFALPLSGPDRTALEPIEVSEAMIWTSDVTEAYSFNILGVFLDVTTVFSGRAANWNRYRWAVDTATDISDEYLAFYAGRYPGIEPVRTAWSEDDRLANRVTVHERYYLSMPAMIENGLREDFLFGAEDFGNSFPDAQIGQRTTPMTIGEPRINLHKVRVKNAPVSFEIPEKVEITNDAFTYKFSGVAGLDGDMSMFWRFGSKDRVIPAAEVAGVIRDARRIADSAGFSWNLLPDEGQ